MSVDNKKKQLFKLLFAAAWLDGKIHQNEREYLHRMVRENALAEDEDIKLLLTEMKPIQSEQCYQWLEEYLGKNPSEQDYQELLESLSGIIYVDNDIAVQESQFLTYLQTLEANKSIFNQVLRSIQKLYLKAMAYAEK
ncbi:MAG: TerB family tellurite resistance protein [Gloeocapsa sp. DLM2.Bin57]|nr:MAG: TerB family tellurite resistance protein [Gloeocapsa sp. DLM2.Bin57]